MSVKLRLERSPRIWLLRMTAVARVTFWEIIREKVLYNIVIFTVLLLGMGVLASRLTSGHPERIVLDFGVSAVSIASMMIALFGGATLLPREFERRTLYVALSKPVTRPQFVFGKFVGLALVSALNVMLLCGAFLLVLSLTGRGLSMTWSTTLLSGLILIVVQGWMVAALAVMVSSISTASLSAMITLGIYLIGTNVSQIRFIAAKIATPWISRTIEGLSLLIPNLEYFSLGTKITYGLPIGLPYFLGCISYGFFWIAISIGVAGILVKWREL